MTATVPLSTHLALLVLPAVVALAAIFHFLRGGRRER